MARCQRWRKAGGVEGVRKGKAVAKQRNKEGKRKRGSRSWGEREKEENLGQREQSR